MKFQTLSEYFEKIEQTSSRLEMTYHLADLFEAASEDEIAQILYLLQGRVAPLFENLEFNMGDKMVIQAAAQAMEIDKSDFTTLFKQYGDIGVTTELLKQKHNWQQTSVVSVLQVFNRLKKMAEMSGQGSVESKMAVLSELIVDLDPLSTRYVVRIPINKLRLGFSDMTVLDAFSWMLKKNKSLRSTIEKAYHVRPDMGFIGTVLKSEGETGLDKVGPVVFTPILMMKAERLSDSFEIYNKAEGGFIEPKYDGFRLQAHSSKGKVVLFSRGLEDMTYMYPDIVDAILHEMDYADIIIEGEAVGYSPKTGALLPFQETVSRKRKYNIEEMVAQVPLRFYAFDLLYLNGQTLIDAPLSDRRRALSSLIKTKKNGNLRISPDQIVTSASVIDDAFAQSAKDNFEGIMIKKLDGRYYPGARNWSWIKYKKSYAAKVDDTIDCLVMGYDFGEGKRTDFGIGAILVGVYDKKTDEFKTVCKIGTGLTDDEWKTIKKMCDNLASKTKPTNYDVDKMMEVDTWVLPGIILEIRSDEITRSPVHTAGRVMQQTKTGKGQEVKTPGFALRFPRLERVRDDKLPEDATTTREVEDLCNGQKN